MLAAFVLAGSLALGQNQMQEPAPDKSPTARDELKAGVKSQVNKLIHKLDADRKTTRDQAEDDLIKLGPGILELLPTDQSTANLSADQLDRLTKIRQLLQHEQAEASFDGTTVTLKGKTTLAKALAALQAQTGNRVEARQSEDEANDEFELQFDKTPFFTALETLCDRRKLTIYPYGLANALQLRNRLPDELPLTGRSVLSGPLRIEPTRVLASRDLRRADEASLVVMLEVAWEPRLQPIAVKLLHNSIEATDEQGQALAVHDPMAEKEAFGRGSVSAVTMEVPLRAPTTPVRKIGHLKGSIRAMLPGKMETFRFTNILKKGSQDIRIAAAKVTLEEVRKNSDTWEFAVHVAFDDAGDALDSHRNWILQNPACLEGPDRKPIPYDTMETTERDKNGIGLSYQFAMKELPAQAVFVYKTPVMIVTKDFPWELKDIRLP